MVSGGLVISLTRQSLIEQLDADLQTANDADVTAAPAAPGENDPTGRRFALLVFDVDGEQLRTYPSGLANSPDSPPAVPKEGLLSLPVSKIVQLPSADGSLSYRVLTLRGQLGPQNVILVLAAPMQGIEASIQVMARTLLIVGFAVLALILIIGWFIIRHDLRPLESITQTAELISEGDLSQRVGVPDDGSEVGRLGQAFDTMLDQIQGAFDSQHAALVAKERSEKKLRQFVADASHELRTPLTAVRGYSELYRAGGLDDEESLDQAMARIGSESRRMGALVEDLLLLARAGSDSKHVPVRESLDVRALLVATADRYAGARVPVSVAGGPAVYANANSDELRRVLANLVDNAVHHASSKVVLQVRAEGGDAVLTVVDDGPGIPADERDRVFERFARLDDARDRDAGGTGLGLAIVRELLRRSDGSISLQDNPSGPGLAAVVRLAS